MRNVTMYLTSPHDCDYDFDLQKCYSNAITFYVFRGKEKGWMEVRVINSAQRSTAETGLARDRLVSCVARSGEEGRKIKRED